METLIQVSLRFITVIYETSIYIWQNHWENDDIYIYILIGGAITILKNDGVRQWEG